MNMNKKGFLYRQHLGSRITTIILIAVTVSVIVLFLPRNSGPQFRYDVGKPWMHGSLIAKFDFPIYKTDAAIKAEKDSISSNFEPYYNYDINISKENVDGLRQIMHRVFRVCQRSMWLLLLIE